MKTQEKSYTLISQNVAFNMVPVVGLEPTRCCHQRILSFGDNPEPATL